MNDSMEDRQITVFKESYGETLLFLKHQDDKINRVLTALAFLTGGAVTLYIFSRSGAPAPLEFDGTNVTAVDYYFGSFVIGLFVAVSVALVALDPTSFVPRFFSRYAPSTDPDHRPVLYWRAIADMDEKEWIALKGHRTLKATLANSFHADARRLSLRAAHKVRRFSTASAAVQFAVVALVLLGIMRLTDLQAASRWWIAATLLILYSAMPLVDFLYFWLLDFPDVRGVGSAVAAVFFFVPFFVVSTVFLVIGHREITPVTFALYGTLLIRLVASFEIRALGDGLRWFAVGCSGIVSAVGLILMLHLR